jgi:hypothetical protein
MARCEVCGNDYDKSFELIAAGARHTFDSFECAIQAIAPICEHCNMSGRTEHSAPAIQTRFGICGR